MTAMPHVPGLTDEPDVLAPASRKLRKGSALLIPVPLAGAPTAELLASITTNLRLPSPVVQIKRWNQSLVSPVVFTLADGRTIRYEEGGYLNNGARIVETIASALQADAPQLPLFSKADAQDVFQAVMRACATVEQQDAASDARDWQDGLWRLTSAMHHGDYRDSAARWSALKWLTAHPEFDARAVRLAYEDSRYGIPAVVWADGSAFLRAADVFAYVRGVRSERIDVGRISARLGEAGWTHRTVDTYKPGSGRGRTMDDRVRVKVFEVAASSADAPDPGVYLGVPVINDAHARTRTRVETLGHGGTPPEKPMNAEESAARDTSTVRDTIQRTGVPTLVEEPVVDLLTLARAWADDEGA